MLQSKILKVNQDIGFRPVNFTPAFYKKAYKNYLNGDFRDLLALIERAESHSFISGCLFARASSFKRKYSIVPASGSAEDIRVAEFLTEFLNNWNMREFLEDIHDARMKYYSVIAFEWDVVDNRQIPVYYEKYDQKFFRYDPKDFVLKIDMGKSLEEIPPESALVFEASRKPIMLTVLAEYIMMEFGKESWSSFLEVFGEPFVYGEYPLGLPPEKIDELEEQVKKIASSTKGIVPEGTKINVIESNRGTSDHKDYVADCKANISFALLGHEEAAGSDKRMQIGDTQSSIVATTKIAEDDMFWLEEKIKPFFKMVIDRNFSVSKYPSLILDKSAIIDPKTKLTAADLALSAGAQIDPNFFKEYGIPIVSEEPLRKPTFSEQFGGGL